MKSKPAPAGGLIRPNPPPWLLAALLGVLTIALYWPVIHNGFVNYDDDTYVTANFDVQKGLTGEGVKWAFSHTVSCNWHPVTMLSHMLDCQLYGLQPWGHHLTSLLLHALDAVLLFLLLWRLTGAMWRSAWVAAVFAWHPLHVESVAWVAERKDVLSTGLGFLALLFYVRYAEQRRERSHGPAAEQRDVASFYHSPCYWLAWFCLALGLMSKPMLVTWPFVLCLLDYWPLGRFQPGRRKLLVMEKIPFFALATAASVVTFAVQKQEGAVKALAILPLGMRCENALISYGRYLLKMIWPADLAVFYPHPGFWPLGWVLLAGIGLAGLSALFWANRRRFPFLLVGWLWFVGTLVPVIGLVQVGIQSMADRYTYIPSVGLLIVIAWGVQALTRRWRNQAVALSVAGAAALVFCLLLTRQQIGYWQNSEVLFRHTLKVTNDNDTARNGLGLALLDQVQTDAAIRQFRAALRLNPNCVEARENLGNALAKQGQTNAAISELQEVIHLRPDEAKAHNNLGNLLVALGQADEAAGQFQLAIRLQPDYAAARHNFGCLLAMQGQTNNAISQFQQALRLDPGDTAAHIYLGNLLAGLGQTDAAVSEFQAAIHLQPDDAEAHYQLGNLLAKSGETAAAIGEFQAAVRLKPDFASAYNNLGNLLAMSGQADAAISQLQKAVELKPDFASAHYNLGNLLLKQGRLDEAISQFQAALQQMPDFAPAHYNLGVAFSQKGQTDAAIGQFQEAIRLKPDYAIAYNSLGIAYGGQGRINEAISQFQAALRLKPDYAEARNHLAHALEMTNAPAAR